MVVELCDRLTLTFSFSASTAPIECVLRSPLSAAPRGSEPPRLSPSPRERPAEARNNINCKSMY